MNWKIGLSKMKIKNSTQHLQIKNFLYSENWKFFQVSLRVNSFIVTALCATPECPWRAMEMGRNFILATAVISNRVSRGRDCQQGYPVMHKINQL